MQRLQSRGHPNLANGFNLRHQPICPNRRPYFHDLKMAAGATTPDSTYIGTTAANRGSLCFCMVLYSRKCNCSLDGHEPCGVWTVSGQFYQASRLAGRQVVLIGSARCCHQEVTATMASRQREGQSFGVSVAAELIDRSTGDPKFAAISVLCPNKKYLQSH